MGNTTSAQPTKTLTAKEKDIKYLAERFPFGDKELEHLHTVYHTILKQQFSKETSDSSEKKAPSSFLVQWSVQCCSPSLRQERETLFQVIEAQILPPDWSRRLYQTSFCTSESDDIFGYTMDRNISIAEGRQPSAMADEFTRKTRLEAFFGGLSNAARRGSKQTLSVLFVACPSVDSKGSYCKAHDIALLAYKLALAVAFLKAAADDTLDMSDYIPSPQDDLSQLDALANSMLQRARDKRANHRFAVSEEGSSQDDSDIPTDCITLDELVEWCDATAPLFASILPTFLHHVFFPLQSYPPSRTAFEYPYCLQSTSFFESPRCPRLFTFACLSSALCGSFFRLYASDQDGLSFNRLQNALVGYNGPTLVMIRNASNPCGVFGAFTASPWKESKDFYGMSDCFLYQLSPRTAVYRPTGNARNFMYCNPQARSKGYDKQAHGLGFGGTVDQPRLFLAENFDDNIAASADLTFENGPLLPAGQEDGIVGSQRTTFAIDALEVWGVGGDEVVQQALGARDKARAIKDEGIQRARKVDKAQFLDDFRSGAIASKAFAYKEQIDGRADQDVEERNRNQRSALG